MTLNNEGSELFGDGCELDFFSVHPPGLHSGLLGITLFVYGCGINCLSDR